MDDDLEKNTYQFSPQNGSSYVTVSLTNHSTGATVEDWNAMYRTGGNDDLRPVTQDAEAPVFYRRTGESQVQFVFNENGTVDFVANPGVTDQLKYRWESYKAGFSELFDSVESLTSSTGFLSAGGVFG